MPTFPDAMQSIRGLRSCGFGVIILVLSVQTKGWPYRTPEMYLPVGEALIGHRLEAWVEQG